MVSIYLYQFIFPPTVQGRSLSSTPSPAFIVCRLFDSSHSDWHEMVPHGGFDLHFSDNEWCWASFHGLIAICMSSLEKCLFTFLVLCLLGNSPIFKSACLIYYCWVLRFLCIFWIIILYQMYHLQIFSSQSVACLVLLTLCITEQKFKIFMKSSLSIISFMDYAFSVVSKNSWWNPRSQFSPLFCPRNLIVCVLYLDILFILS